MRRALTRPIVVALLALALSSVSLLVSLERSAFAANQLAMDAVTTTTDVTLTTTSETVAVSSGVFASPRDTVRVLVVGYGQLSTGTGTTSVTPRIRRGTTTSGTLVGDATTEEVKAAAGSDEPFLLMVSEERTGGGVLQYSLTLTQAGATGNGTLTQGGILVIVF